MKVLSTIHFKGQVLNAGDELPADFPKEQLQSVIDAGAVEGDKTQAEVGTPMNPSRFGAGEVAPQMSEETIDAQIAELEARKKALQDSKSASTKSDESKSGSDEPKPFEKMNKRELMEAGQAKGVTLEETMTNKEMVEALNNAE